jgi:hypothetical protein
MPRHRVLTTVPPVVVEAEEDLAAEVDLAVEEVHLQAINMPRE